MPGPAEEDRTVVGTFADPRHADLAAEAARKAGFEVQRRSDGAVIVDAGQHAQHVPEVQAILGAYGAREFGGPQTVSTTTETGTGAQTGQSAAGVEERREQRIRAEEGARVELVEEELRARIPGLRDRLAAHRATVEEAVSQVMGEPATPR